MLVDLTAIFCICILNKLIKAKAIFLLNFLFKIFFDTKTLFKSSHRSCFLEKAVKNIWKICKKTTVLESFFNEVAGLQGLHTHLRFYFSLGETLKNFINFL